MCTCIQIEKEIIEREMGEVPCPLLDEDEESAMGTMVARWAVAEAAVVLPVALRKT